MRRRTLLQTATAALTTVLAGCATDSDGTTPTANRTATGSPTETSAGTRTETATETSDASADVVAPIRDLWTAYNDENGTGVAAAFHPDAPSPPQADSIAFQGTVTIENTTVTDQSADEATVVGTFTLAGEDTTETQEQTYQLRRHDGDWLIYSIEMDTGDDSASEAPQISFAFEYDDRATSASETGVLTITHSGGDNVDAARLSVRGDGIVLPEDADPDVTVSGTGWAQATGIETVAAGNEITVGVSSDCSVRVVWESAAGDSSATLAAYDGPDA